MAEQAIVEVIPLPTAGRDQKLQFFAQVAEGGRKALGKPQHLGEGAGIWLIYNRDPDPAIRERRHKFLPQIRLAATLRQGA